ncbi:MAG: metal ABC transporter permease [Thermacetogeniaceae bacterium]
MEFWYGLIGHLLPFQWAHFIFMKNALLAVLLITPVFGLTGTMVVNNRMAFFSDAMGHAALTGIALGVIMGMGNPLWAMLIFAALLGGLITWAYLKTETSLDTVIGVFFAVTVALGVIILSRGGGFNKYSVYLIGDLLSITPNEILMLAVVLIAVLVLWFTLFNKFFLVSFNASVARSRGVNIALIQMIFSIMLALIVTISIQWVGILIINSLIILPAAAARNVSTNMRSYHVVTIVISLISGLVGLILSFYWGTASGATIVLCTFIFYLLTIVRKGLLMLKVG